MDSRYTQLQSWLEQHGLDASSLRPASADASFRRYFRLDTPEGSRIIMDAPPDKEDSRPFIRVATMLAGTGVHVPEIIEADLQQGFILLSDLGSTDYLSSLSETTVATLYGDAMQALLTMQQKAGHDLPAYDETLLRTEMSLFPDWYLGTHCQLELNTAQQAIIQQTFDLLVDNALQQPRVFVHRDYHSRNLMVCEENNPGILDFQDAVYGPVTYDLVSLLRDCYVAWPRQQVETWVNSYYHDALKAGIVGDVGVEQFLRWFDLMGVQRHLKASGIFARLNHRDNKPGYLRDIPRTLSYIHLLRDRYPQLQAFVSLLDELKLPDWQQQHAG